MKLKLNTASFDFETYTEHAHASIHLRPETEIKAQHFPKSDRCHEFVSINIAKPDDDEDVCVSIYGAPEDVRRLAQEILDAIPQQNEAAA